MSLTIFPMIWTGINSLVSPRLVWLRHVRENRGMVFSHNYDQCTLSALSKHNANIINQPNEKHVQKKQGANLLLWSTGQQVHCVLLWFRVMCERAFVISKMQLDQQLPKGDVNYAFVTSFLHCWEYKYFIFKLHLQI